MVWCWSSLTNLLCPPSSTGLMTNCSSTMLWPPGVKAIPVCEKGFEVILFFNCKGSFHNNLFVLVKLYLLWYRSAGLVLLVASITSSISFLRWSQRQEVEDGVEWETRSRWVNEVCACWCCGCSCIIAGVVGFVALCAQFVKLVCRIGLCDDNILSNYLSNIHNSGWIQIWRSSQRNSITMYDDPLLEDIARTMVLSSEKKEIDK